MEVGDYVLATKYSDGDPRDHWFVGWFDGMLKKVSGPRYEIVDTDGNLVRGNGFRRCQKITKEQGAYLLRNRRLIQGANISVWGWLNLAQSETS